MIGLDRVRGALRARGLAIALPLQLAVMLLWPVAAAAIPPLPGGPPPIIPVPNPFVPSIGSPQGAGLANCGFAPLGATEVRTLFRESGNATSNFGIDPANPCHVFRAVGSGVFRSDNSGQGFVQSFFDRSQSGSIHGAPFTFSPVTTAGTGGGPAYIYDVSGSNGVVYTPDDGQSWEQRINGLYSGGSGPTGGITAFAVAPGNAAVAYLAGSVAGQPVIYSTTDGGSSWRVAGQLQFPVTSLSVDPANSHHVVAAAGGPTTNVGRAATAAYYDSPDSGTGWNAVAAPPGEGAPIQVVIGGGQRVYAETGTYGATQQDITQVTGQKFWRLEPARGWRQLSVPSSLGKDSVIAYNRANPDEMIIASAAGLGLAMAGSYDGFGSTRFAKVIRTDQQVSGVQLLADRGGQFFALAKGGGEDQLLALRISALAPDPPAAGAPPVHLETALNKCDLADLSKPGTLPGTRTTVYYKSGSLAFDGRYLDYTNDDVGPPGVIYRIDPATCAEQPSIVLTNRDFQGPPLPLLGVTFDPRYVFDNGHTGAILARGGTGPLHDPRITNADDVAIYAIDPSPNPAPMELAASQTCGHSITRYQCDAYDPNLFNYDHYLDALWILVPGDYDVPVKGLAKLPARKGGNNRVVPMPTCMSSWNPPDPGNTDMAMWEPGADGILYVAMENPNDTLMLRVNSRTCQYLDAFTHETYSEGPPKASNLQSDETDQMACDAITFGPGSAASAHGAGTSALWIRDNALNLVRAYPIAHGFCPFPSTLQVVDGPTDVKPGQTVTYCVLLQASTAGTPKGIGGQTVQFTLGGTAVGSAVTNAEGRACLTTTAPANAGNLKLVATYPGSEAYLPASVARAVKVAPQPTFNPPLPKNQSLPPAHVAPPNPAIVPAPPPVVQASQAQAQAQAQAQVQAQAQSQPGLMTEKQKQARVNLARIDGGKQMADIEASRYHAAVFAQGTGLGMFGIGLWVRYRRNRRRRPLQAQVDTRPRRRS